MIDRFVSSSGIKAKGSSSRWGIDEAYGEGGTWCIDLRDVKLNPWDREECEKFLASLRDAIVELKEQKLADEIQIRGK